MKRYLYIAIMFFVSSSVIAQTTQLMLGATPTYIKFSGGTSSTPIYLVIGNPATNAITRTAGWIISEGQYNYVSWKNSAASTSYTFPFGYSNTDYIPFTFAKTAGAATDLIVSTWGTLSDNTPWAEATDGGTIATVTNMHDINGQLDGSACCVIDRWWTIYTTATASLTFTYRGAENTMTSGTGAIIGIQHWNGTYWNNGSGGGNGTIASTGTTGYTSGDNTLPAIGGFTQFSPYVLVSLPNPLPIEWLSVSAECAPSSSNLSNTVEGNVIIKWSTASEQNSDYFTVERSQDGTTFEAIATVSAAHNSNSVKKYSITDNDRVSENSYYRIKETDYDGKSITSDLITVDDCNNDKVIIYSNEGNIYVNILSTTNQQYAIELYSMLGQRLNSQLTNVSAGENITILPNKLAIGIYLVTVKNINHPELVSGITTKKVFIHSIYK